MLGRVADTHLCLPVVVAAPGRGSQGTDVAVAPRWGRAIRSTGLLGSIRKMLRSTTVDSLDRDGVMVLMERENELISGYIITRG